VSNQGWDLRARHKGRGSVGGKGRWGSEGDGWGRGLVGSMCQLESTWEWSTAFLERHEYYIVGKQLL
jgi:hypothetical protein